MPGFVDVSNMSDLEIKRLCQADEDDIDSRPRSSRRQVTPQVGYPVSDVWAAACAAQRVNGEYLKESKFEWDEAAQTTKLVRRRNRDIMIEFLQNPDRLTTDDVEAGEQCRNFLQQDLTFRALKSKLTEFDASVSKCLAVQDRFYTVQHRYELAVVACLPQSAKRTQVRQEADQRMQFATEGYLADVGAKVSTNVEVIACSYSQQYNIHWIRGITHDGYAVMFSSKTAYDPKTHLTIQGKVKAHRDNLTQLNYVKVL